MSDLFGSIFEDLFSSQSRKRPLRRKGDIDFELESLEAELRSHGNEIVLSSITKLGENIIIYRQHVDDEYSNIILRSRIFSVEGILSLTPSMYLTFRRKHEILEIADIRIEEIDTNKGYGSVFMEALFFLVSKFTHPIKYITGWISSVDWHHVERNQHFYEKYGFQVELDEAVEQGKILWINPLLNGSIEHFRSLNYEPGFFGLLTEINDLDI
ncbi:hypothetical protein EHV15_34925 [Paenibacillus oralis]|uniref:GNAT family N-acetyltransferase n=1 Tax=Paenibacillus oralis TaxID=2490856 RepID=A0A3P3T9V8_9BACL|nr:hypothetical protein [Paenibacillus oralis]RRJ54787.1 hypothetical protein EHV15_34925 [Paenibacillus oralis]